MIVDDSEIIINRLTDLLKEQECISSINAANSFNEAVALLNTHNFNLAILDINIPGKNGIELLTHIKEHFPSVSTIMLTNQSDSYYRDLCSKIGTDEYVDKTNDFDQIPAMINNFYTIYSKH